jgi:hypothetical protein
MMWTRNKRHRRNWQRKPWFSLYIGFQKMMPKPVPKWHARSYHRKHKDCLCSSQDSHHNPAEKPQKIKEIPNFVDPKIEEEHMFNMVVNHLQLFDEWYYYLVEGEVLYFPLRIVNPVMGTKDQICN